MKKFLLTLLGVLTMLPASALDFEYTYEGQTLKYSTTDENEVSARKQDTSVSGDIIIPEIVEYEGTIYSVTSIPNYAFYGCSSLTSVTIPNSVTSIPNYAFYGCSSLTSVTIPNSVTSIGKWAFDGCSSLTSVTIPNSVTTIEDCAFSGCSSLTSVTIPNSVTSIGISAFSGCSSLTSVTIPNSVTTIEDCAFSGCSSLTSVTIPNSVTSIGGSAFTGCSSLTSVTIPNSVTSIGGAAFYGCSSLTSVTFGNSVTSIGSNAFEGCSSLTSMTIPTSVTSIGESAFLRTNIKKIAYPNTLNLEDTFGASEVYAYNPEEVLIENNFIYSRDRKALFFTPYILSDDNNFRLPENIERIGKEAFASNSIDTLYIPASLRYIEEDAFKDCKIERVVFDDWKQWFDNITLANLMSNPYAPKEVKVDDWNTMVVQPQIYEGETLLEYFELPYDLTRIPDYVGVGISFRDEVEIPYSVKRIGAYAFYNNKELYHVFLNDSLEEIGECAFFGCELLENLVFPATLKKIESAAFAECTSITEIILPETLTVLGGDPICIVEEDKWGHIIEKGGGVFSNCTSLERAVVTIDCDSISERLFDGCLSLYKLYLPYKLRHIGDRAFHNCIAVDEIKLPVTLESIGEMAFGIDEYRYEYLDKNIAFGHKMKGSLTNFVIPNSVNSIGSSAFENQSLRNLKIGSGLERIERSVFKNNQLNTIEFSEGLIAIESDAFSNNSFELSSVILPSTIKEINENAFAETSIQELVIPDGVLSLPSGSCGRPALLTVGKDVKTIDANAFSFENLITFRLKATMPPTLNEAFPITNDQNDQLTLVVNQGRVVSYKNNARWKQINRIIQEDWTDIEVHLDGTFSLAEEIRMQNGLMPSQVNKMKVFGPLDDNDLRVIRENMVSLRSLDLSEVTNVTAIPDGQFKESLLDEIILPVGVERIGKESFANSRLLTMDALPETITSIGDRAFEGCIRVTFSRMPESLTELGEGAFSGCSAIKEMAFTNQFSGSLPPYTFQDCTLLERVDLSSTEIRSIEQEAFRGCYELDEIILPATLTSISYAAFYGTAIRDISFLPADVYEIGEEAFSNCRRLVAATLPQTMTSVSSNIFSGCGRLLTVSMPAGILSVGRDLVNGDKKLSNISCAAIDAPDAETGAFDNIRLRYVSLTVPTLSFRTYLSAPQWGKFETIQNRISTSIGNKVVVTNVAENEYQDMLEEDRLEELQETSTQAPQEEEQPGNMRRRAARRAAARAVTNRSFAALFDGAQIQTGDEGSGTRIFINPEEGVNVTSVKFNGEEMLDKMEGNSLLLPAGSKGELEISTDTNVETGIGEVTYDEATAPIYTLTGTKVGRGRADLSNLQPGIYIFCGRKIAVK